MTWKKPNKFTKYWKTISNWRNKTWKYYDNTISFFFSFSNRQSNIFVVGLNIQLCYFLLPITDIHVYLTLFILMPMISWKTSINKSIKLLGKKRGKLIKPVKTKCCTISITGTNGKQMSYIWLDTCIVWRIIAHWIVLFNEYMWYTTYIFHNLYYRIRIIVEIWKKPTIKY